ncbi:hypothetical protein [Halomicrococcus sp. NG-SE-24]
MLVIQATGTAMAPLGASAVRRRTDSDEHDADERERVQQGRERPG